MGNVTGTISRSPVSPERVNWTIPGFFDLPRLYDITVESPSFPVADTKWILATRCKFDIIELELRKDSGPITLPFAVIVGILGADGREHICRWGATNEAGEFMCTDFLDLKVIEGKKNLFVPKGKLTIFCKMHTGVPAEAATQTETETQTGHTNKAERSVNNAKAIQVDVSFPQTAARHFDAATQTEEAVTRQKRESLAEAPNLREESTALNPFLDICKLQQDYENLLQSGEGSDVSLKVSGRVHRAHRYILGARSPVFCSMFEHDMVEKTKGVVEIDDLDPECFESFLQYLYAGRIQTFTKLNVCGLYYAADKYDIQGLKHRCVDYMKRTLTEETFCDFLVVALRHREKELLQQAIEFFCKNLKTIIVSIGWQGFLRQYPTEANELLIKALASGN